VLSNVLLWGGLPQRALFKLAQLIPNRISAASQDILDGFTDWSDDVINAHIKVTLFQGKTDPNVSIMASRGFANNQPEQIELIELEGGGLLNYSHANII
jgi:hypothetical protein